jgi:hypothetical protein
MIKGCSMKITHNNGIIDYEDIENCSENEDDFINIINEYNDFIHDCEGHLTIDLNNLNFIVLKIKDITSIKFKFKEGRG